MDVQLTWIQIEWHCHACGMTGCVESTKEQMVHPILRAHLVTKDHDIRNPNCEDIEIHSQVPNAKR